MATITINDLSESAELDAKAMAAITGGFSLGWIVPYQNLPKGRGRPSVLNQYFTLNQFIADEIQIINQHQSVNVIDSAGAVVDLEENANNGLTKAAPLTLL
jgi:hypothetical protein